MKIMLSALLVLSVFAFMLPATANAANVEGFGMVSAGIGAERETGATFGCTNLATAVTTFDNNGGSFSPHSCAGNPGARGMASVLGVLPFAMPNLGLQLGAKYNGGAGSRFGATLGPVYGWDGGKSGVILDFQYRTRGQSNFFWLSPALSLYVGDMNVNLSYTHPISSIQEGHTFVEKASVCGEICGSFFTRWVPTNRIQGSVSFFPINSLEASLGVQVNTFAGPTKLVRSTGVGPVFGLAWMPIDNLNLDLVKGTVDNRSRYNIQSGVSWVFNAGSTKGNNLKEIRRKYLQIPEPGVAVAGPFTHKSVFRP